MYEWRCFIIYLLLNRVSVEVRVGWRVRVELYYVHCKINGEIKMGKRWARGLENLLILQDNVTGSVIFTEHGSKSMGHGASLVSKSCERVRHFYADYLSFCWFIGHYWHSGSGWCVTRWCLTLRFHTTWWLVTWQHGTRRTYLFFLTLNENNSIQINYKYKTVDLQL